MKTITWNEVLAGDVVIGEDGLEWFVFDRADGGEVALIRCGSQPIVGMPDAAAPVQLCYRGALGVAADLLGGEVIGHVDTDGPTE